jgi:uncharacterized membrane protein YfbV (UPF0208 family)
VGREWARAIIGTMTTMSLHTMSVIASAQLRFRGALMKILSATGTAICTALLLCTLPTGGQQQETQRTRSEGGCKMGGHWESGCYEKIVESIPTVKGKAEYLARVADELQSQLETEKQLRELKLPPAGTYQSRTTHCKRGQNPRFHTALIEAPAISLAPFAHRQGSCPRP